MSYKFNGANCELYANYGASKGSLSSTYAFPLTMAFFLKRAVWVVAYQYAMTLAYADGTEANSLTICLQSTTYDWLLAQTADNTTTYTNTPIAALTQGMYAGKWIAAVAVYEGSGNTCTARRIYLASSARTASNTGLSIPFDGNMGKLYIGESSLGGGDVGAASPNEDRVAHVAVWNSILSPSDVDLYAAGQYPGYIGSNLVGYWPLRKDTRQQAGSDSAGSLAVSNAVLDSDDNPSVIWYPHKVDEVFVARGGF